MAISLINEKIAMLYGYAEGFPYFYRPGDKPEILNADRIISDVNAVASISKFAEKDQAERFQIAAKFLINLLEHKSFLDSASRIEKAVNAISWPKQKLN